MRIKYNIQISQNNMASRLAKAPLLQAKRQFAAQAAVAAKQAELGSASGQVNINWNIISEWSVSELLSHVLVEWVTNY